MFVTVSLLPHKPEWLQCHCVMAGYYISHKMEHILLTKCWKGYWHVD